MPTKNAKKSKLKKSPSWKGWALKWLPLGVVVLVLGATLVGRTLSRGDDFRVFYQVAHRFWDGVRPYDGMTYGNMVFKYPPWILPFFIPFGFFDSKTAQFLWGLIEFGALVAIVIRIHRGFPRAGLPSVRPGVQALFLAILFALFGSHGMTGQITLVVLAFALWVDPLRAKGLPLFGLFTAFSAKVTSAFSLLHFFQRKKAYVPILGVLTAWFVLSLPVYFKSYDRHYGVMKREWISAMFSGTQDVNSVRIGFTTREVQGLPSLILRKGNLNENEPVHVLFSTLLSVVLVGGGWIFMSRSLHPQAQWIGWVALLPAVQPLAWFHVFLLGYPVLAFGAELALREKNFEQKRWKWIGIIVCGLAMGAVTQKTMGSLGLELELASIKLWGLLGAVALWKSMLDRPLEHTLEGSERSES